MGTPTIADGVAKRRGGAPRKPRTFAGALGGALLGAAVAAGFGHVEERWPSERYQADPVAFAREQLGVEPWDRQIEILEAVVPPRARVAVTSGHKVSKSHTAGIIALWFYSSFDDARVVMSSTTARQVDQILWREVRKMHARSGVCLECRKASFAGEAPCPHARKLDGEPMVLARSGLRAQDFREVVGFTAREAEAVAGISGANLLYILDEASGIPEVIFEAIEGNRAGGARVIMFSNPTRTEGEFFEAFNSKQAFYRTIRISSEETPNVREGRIVVPGLATREWIDEKRLEWGVDSPLYKVRVKGEFVLNEDGKIFSVHALSEAEARWYETPAEGRLQVGLDPAGPGEGGDETVFAVRRGLKLLAVYPFRGLSEAAHLAHLLGILKEHREPHERRPLVALDREGPIGSAIAGLFRAHVETHEDAFDLLPVRASDRAQRNPQVYDRMRDELWANLAEWLRDGGALVEDVKLAKELHAPEWVGQVTSRLKVTPKSELRKALGRSPDRADAVTLAVWEPRAGAGVEEHNPAVAASEPEESDAYEPSPMSPYGSPLDPWGGRR